MFGQETHVIGRTCEVDKTVNSSSVSTGNFLLENYEFIFDGEITVTENCPYNGSIVSQNWTFNNTAKIILPLVCSQNSTKINCNSLALHSRQTEEIHLEQHRMQVIIQENFEETKAQLSATSFIRSSSPIETINSSPILSFMDSQKWIFIGIGVLITAIGILFLSYKICQHNG